MGALNAPMTSPVMGGGVGCPHDAPLDGGATYHCKQTSNIDIYPSTSWGLLDAPMTPSIVGGVGCLM